MGKSITYHSTQIEARVAELERRLGVTPEPLPGHECIKRHGLKPGDRVLCVSSEELRFWTVGKTYRVLDDCLRDDEGDPNTAYQARFIPAPTVTQTAEVKWPGEAPITDDLSYAMKRFYAGWNACKRTYDAALAQAPAPAGYALECPDALLPDGPICPACGGKRFAVGGHWVHDGTAPVMRLVGTLAPASVGETK